jgi:hypothetical protein
MRFTEINRADLPKFDESIYFASYEDRCVAVALDQADGKTGSASILHCEDIPSPQMAANLLRLQEICGDQGTSCRVSSTDPRPIIEFSMGLASIPAVLVDVTCFTRANLLTLLWAWDANHTDDQQIVFSYCPPDHYGPWLSRDFGTPHNIVGFSGPAAFARDRTLVCLVGFDSDRAWELIRYLEPTRVVLGVGTPTRAEFESQNRDAIAEVLSHCDAQIVEIPVTDPSRTQEVLDALIAAEKSDDCVHVAPFNNKLSCLAAFSVWQKHPAIRMWNVLPAGYNYKGYSVGHRQPRYFRASW